MKSRAGLIAWLLAAIAILSLTAAFFLQLSSARNAVERVDSAWALSWVGFPVVGALIASRRPSTRIGWVLVAIGTGLGIGLAGLVYAERVFVEGANLPAPELVLWFGWLSLVLGYGLVPFLILLFPQDRIESAVWRRTAYLGAATLGVAAILWAVRPSYQVTEGLEVTNPFGVMIFPEAIEATLIAVTAFVGFGVAAAGHAVYRFVRSRGEQRAQMKWFVYATAMFPLLFGVTALLEPVSLDVSNVLGTLTFVVGFNGMAAAIGIAVVRHRLYDIDLVIKRTVVFGALAVFISGVYFVIVGAFGAWVGFLGNVDLSILATAAAAIAFQPVRARVQRFANRLVYGDRLSPYEAMSEFSERMAGALTLEEVLPRMAESAARGTGAERTRVAVFLPDGTERAATWPDGSDGTFERKVAVAHGGEEVGEISLTKPRSEPITRAEEKLLQGLASQAGPALHNVRLAEDLKASRRRIVSAQDEERRRLERNLHDGAQQGLIALKVKLGLAERLAEADPPKARELLTQLQSEADETLENMRDLARGIYPPLLADQGLAAAFPLRPPSRRFRSKLEIQTTSGATPWRSRQPFTSAVWRQSRTRSSTRVPLGLRLS